MSIVTLLFIASGVIVFVLGLQTLLFAPLAIYYEFWKRRFLKRFQKPAVLKVSVIVPAFNEENTILPSVESILASDYPHFEVIVVNDGSSDHTEHRLRPLVDAKRITYINKTNEGKASALNAGIQQATGEIVLFTDADSFFRSDTIGNMARWFADSSVHAVCGNDEPIAPSTALQKLLVITTHIGSGFVRRALSAIRVLPIISGNLGAVRKEWLEKVRGFSDLWGEDLDLTFKLHKAGARIVFDPEARVLCDVPATLRALWNQRVRWMRSFLKICSLHRDLFFSRKYFPFSFYLPMNWLTMVLVPLMQIVAIVLLPVILQQGMYRFNGILEVIAYCGIAVFFAASFFSILLDRSFDHLKYVPLYGWLIIPFSYFYNAVLTYSLYKEFKRATEKWHKIERRNLHWVVLGRNRFGRYAAWAGAGLGVLVYTLITSLTGSKGGGYALPISDRLSLPTIAVATHFDAYSNPVDAVTSVLNRNESQSVNTVGLEAGRVEWNFFKWKGHESTWSNDQKSSRSDILFDAVEDLHVKGKRAVAILDFYAPLYLHDHPTVAALDVEGNPSSEQVCFIELTEGEYGKEIIAMATYLAREYELHGISLTELEYNRYCYDDRCFSSFAASKRAKNWPHEFLSSSIDKDSHDLGEWRSQRMAGFLKVIADSVHRYGKQLYVDVPVHETTLESQGVHSGLYYPYLLNFTDALIVWDYFYLDGRDPSSSIDVARFFTKSYDPEKVIISIGLWGVQHPVSPRELSEAVQYSIMGGATQLWITPNHLMTDAHWKGLKEVLTDLQQSSTQASSPNSLQ